MGSNNSSFSITSSFGSEKQVHKSNSTLLAVPWKLEILHFLCCLHLPELCDKATTQQIGGYIPFWLYFISLIVYIRSSAVKVTVHGNKNFLWKEVHCIRKKLCFNSHITPIYYRHKEEYRSEGNNEEESWVIRCCGCCFVWKFEGT